MTTLWGLLGSAVLCWFVYALFRPGKAVYWHENPSRTKAFGYLLLGMFVIGSMSPNSEDSETDDSSSGETRMESTANKQSRASSQTESTGDEKTSRQGPACEEISGVYRGFYETRLDDRGLGQMIIHSDCEYEVAEDIDEDGEFNVGINDKSVWSSGRLEKSGDDEYILEDGAVITVNGSVVRYSADYAEATMQWSKSIRE